MSKEEERVWEPGWEGHKRAQSRRLAALPMAEKLRWLEEANALVRHLRRKMDADLTAAGADERGREVT